MRTSRVILLLLIIQLPAARLSQPYDQTVRGIVTDSHIGPPLPGATVILTSKENTKGTTTGSNGRFQFIYIFVGRHKLEIFYVGKVLTRLNTKTISLWKRN